MGYRGVARHTDKSAPITPNQLRMYETPTVRFKWIMQAAEKDGDDNINALTVGLFPPTFRCLLYVRSHLTASATNGVPILNKRGELTGCTRGHRYGPAPKT